MELPSSNYIDGRKASAMEIKECIMNAATPQVFQNTIDTWPAATWSLDEFTEMFGNIMTKFKLYHKENSDEEPSLKIRKTDFSVNKIALENECYYAKGSFDDFKQWLLDSSTQTNLSKYKRLDYWCYADYNYMVELFANHPSVLHAVDWGVFGFIGRNAEQSTIWVGSEEAYTPCHQDTYGLNLVAQICGLKRWLLLPPDQSKWLQSTRIPYEESSVFTSFSKEKLKSNPKCVQVDLKPGEVLYVPKHWWHFVECVEPSISINTWIELDSDINDRLRESLVQTLVYGMKTAENSPTKEWLNPNQEVPTSFKDCLDQVKMAFNERKNKENFLQPSTITNDLLINSLCDTEVLDKIISVMEQRLER